MTITVTQAVTEVALSVEQNGNQTVLQPTIMVNPTSTLYMLKSIYDPAEKEEQVLTISSTIDGGTL